MVVVDGGVGPLNHNLSLLALHCIVEEIVSSTFNSNLGLEAL